jgi:phospholipid/cholesterol/gamma-HCH transport system substrate-binding protein
VSKEFKIGLIAVASALIFYYGFNFLKGIDFFSKTSGYYVIYKNVDGLSKSNPVIINGLAVGKISKIKLLQESQQILVELNIEEDIILGDSTIAELADTDLLGSKAVILRVGPLTNPRQPGDTLIAYIDPGLAAYLDDVQPIADNINIAILRISQILQGMEGVGADFKSTVKNTNELIIRVNSLLEQNESDLEKAVNTTNDLLKNIGAKVDQLDPILAKSTSILDSIGSLEINQTVTEINAALAQINELLLQIDNGEGTVGKLMKNDSLYNNLNQLMIDLDKTVIHFNEYPKDFLKPLGRKNSKLKGLETEGN